MFTIFIDHTLHRFINSLNDEMLGNTLRAIELLEKYGNELGMPDSRPIGHRLFELRVSGRVEVRLIYAFRNDMIVLLHGFIKKSRRTPPRDIRTARKKNRLLT